MAVSVGTACAAEQPTQRHHSRSADTEASAAWAAPLAAVAVAVAALVAPTDVAMNSASAADTLAAELASAAVPVDTLAADTHVAAVALLKTTADTPAEEQTVAAAEECVPVPAAAAAAVAQGYSAD